METCSLKGDPAGHACMGEMDGGQQKPGNLTLTTTKNMFLTPNYTMFLHIKRKPYFWISQIVFPGTAVTVFFFFFLKGGGASRNTLLATNFFLGIHNTC